MDTGEWVTRSTVWLALSLYVASELAKTARGVRQLGSAARWLNAAGCAVFLVHVVCAFYFYHHWSHAAAYADTARQTAEMFGLNWGGGLYLNYVFTLVWLGEVIWFLANSSGYLHRPGHIHWIVRAFFFFMIINGAFVFVRGAIRWFGLVLCLALIGCWWSRRKRMSLIACF